MTYISTNRIERDIFNPNIIYVNNNQYNYNKTYVKHPFNKY